MRKGVSAVLPAYKETRNLERLLPALLDSGAVDECIVVEDPSEDPADRLVESLRARYGEKLRYRKNPERLGIARSLAEGISLASFSHCLIRDSDWNHEIALTPRFRESAAKHDFVLASRYLAGFPPLGRINDLFSLLLNLFLRRIFGAVTDWTLGYFLFRRGLLEDLPVDAIFQGRGEYTLRLYRAFLRKGIVPLEIPTRVQDRGFGRSTTSLLRHGAAYLRTLLEPCPLPVRAQYDAYASRYGTGAAGAGHSILGWRARRKLLERFREPPEGECLDVGCGNGFVARHWARRRNLSLTGIDFAEGALRVARETGAYRELRKLDLCKDPVEGSFGSVLCCEVLQYIPASELEAFFSKLASCTKPGTRLYIVAPNREGTLHGIRRFLLGRVHADYRYPHRFADVKAALEAAGFLVEESHGVSYVLAGSWTSPMGEAPPSWCFVYALTARRR